MLKRQRPAKNDFEKFARRVGGKNCQPFSLTVDLVFSESGVPWLVLNGFTDIRLNSNSLDEVLLTVSKYVKERYT